MMRLNPFRRIRAFRGLEYLLAILLTGMFTLIFLPFRSTSGDDHSILSLLYLLPVVLSSVIWGLGPGASASGFISGIELFLCTAILHPGCTSHARFSGFIRLPGGFHHHWAAGREIK